MKLLLVDGYSLLYRAFFSSPPLTTQAGQPTGALYGFARMLLRLLDEYRPEYALVALDTSGPTFRHETYADYKAHRAEVPDDLRAQMGHTRGMLDGLHIAHYEHEGYEGDDILGTLACIGAARGMEVTVVTGDGDALQLVNDQVSVMLTRRGVTDLDCYTPARVHERYGFGPEMVPDYKGLRGDSSDNIPGVPGIGEKTAISLITRYGSMDEIYAQLAQVTPPRISKLLADHRDQAFLSRDLARIVTDLELRYDFDDARTLDLDDDLRATALATVRLFEFKSLIPRYSGEADQSAPAAEGDGLSLQAATVHTCEDATVTLAWLDRQPGPIAVLYEPLADLAETGLTLAHGEEAMHYTGAPAALAAWLGGDAPKIVHDAKSLKMLLGEAGRAPNQDECDAQEALQGVVADTLLMAYLLDPARQSHPLPHLAQRYLARRWPAFEPPAAGKKGASLFPVELTAEQERERVQERGAAACALCALAPALRAALAAIDEEGLFDEIELPLVDVLVGIEACGMSIDAGHLKAVDAQLSTQGARLQAEIWELAGEEFNISSTKQLQSVLFEKLALAKGRSTKTGFSTDVHTLEKLAEEHEIVSKVLEYRGITKLKSTYVDTLLRGLDGQGRIHTNLNQTGAVSGRLSSSDPNLQNIPIRTEQGRLIRKAFTAPPGMVVLAADYSQIELRILAHITGDLPLVEAFQRGEDVHVATAADLFGVAPAEVDSEMRRKAKMTNYAIAYGVSGFGLAKQLGSGTPGEAAQFIERYFQALPGVKNYIDETLVRARRDGYVQTLMGRRRPLPEIVSPRQHDRAAAERTAVNHPIQGSAADIMKIAMLAVAQAMRAAGFEARMTMQVHDELVFEVPQAELADLAVLVERCMREAPTQRLGLKVPLEIEVEAGPNWNDTQAVERHA